MPDSPRSLLLVQTGTPPAPLRAEHGDLPLWFQHALGTHLGNLTVVRVFEGEALPVPDPSGAAIITGSWAMVTDRENWSESTAAWIRQALQAGTSLFGVCYGHQLMAHALGGQVAYLPDGPEIGDFAITLLPGADRDPMLRGVPGEFPAHVSHFQRVLTLPPGAVPLARSARDPHQIVRYAPNAFSTQFHPEFTPAIMASIIRARREILTGHGQDPDALLQQLGPTPEASGLLTRFLHAHQTRTERPHSSAMS